MPEKRSTIITPDTKWHQTLEQFLHDTRDYWEECEGDSTDGLAQYMKSAKTVWWHALDLAARAGHRLPDDVLDSAIAEGVENAYTEGQTLARWKADATATDGYVPPSVRSQRTFAKQNELERRRNAHRG